MEMEWRKRSVRICKDIEGRGGRQKEGRNGKQKEGCGKSEWGEGNGRRITEEAVG